MVDDDRDAGVVPGITALAGAIGVLLVYWFHLFLLELPLTDDTGVSITIFVASFIAQYIPLKILERNYDLQKRNSR